MRPLVLHRNPSDREALSRGPAPLSTYRSPTPAVSVDPGHVIRGPGSPELTLFRYISPDDMPRIDEHSPPLSPGDMLQLQAGPSSGKFRYILEIGGDGRARIYTEAELEKVHWGWEITGPPPTEMIMLLVSERPLPSDLAGRISALGIVPKLAEGTQLVWHDSTREVRQSDRPLRGPQRIEDLRWADRVGEVLKSVEGLAFHGRTLPVEPKASGS